MLSLPKAQIDAKVQERPSMMPKGSSTPEDVDYDFWERTGLSLLCCTLGSWQRTEVLQRHCPRPHSSTDTELMFLLYVSAGPFLLSKAPVHAQLKHFSHQAIDTSWFRSIKEIPPSTLLCSFSDIILVWKQIMREICSKLSSVNLVLCEMIPIMWSRRGHLIKQAPFVWFSL